MGGGNMMDWGGHGFFGLGHLLWWALLIGAAVVLVLWLVRDRPRSNVRAEENRALAILKERYARGDIDKAEFDRLKRDIS